MAAPAAITMLVQAAHQVVTLHFVSKIGNDAVAAVSSAGNVGFIVGALAQSLSVSTAALVAHSAGRKDLRDLRNLFNQAFGLGLLCALMTVGVLCTLAPLYMRTLSGDDAVVDAGVRYLWWISPGFALLFPTMVVTATLRGVGVIATPMLILAITVLLDAAFAFVLIPGRGVIPALGVEGAALATTLSIAIGMIWMLAYFHRTEPGITIHRTLLVPRLAIWRQIVSLGAPAAAELTLMFLSISVVYLALRSQGAAAQAGFGIGFRILQLLILPGLSVSSAAGPIAGQNFGAGNFSRVREVFRASAVLSAIAMSITTAVVLGKTEALLRFFDTDAASAATATSFLQLASWTLVAQGLVYTCASMFQALGNTVPALLSAMARFVVFSVPALWLAQLPGFRTEQVWYLFAVSIAVQAGVSVWLLQIEFRRKLQPSESELAPAVVSGK